MPETSAPSHPWASLQLRDAVQLGDLARSEVVWEAGEMPSGRPETELRSL
jgi:hypothetical protein